MIKAVNTPLPCELCGRVTKRGTTEHHLIPRCCHHNKWFKKRYSREEMSRTIHVCRDCHSSIHRLVPCEKELGRSVNTIELLRQHELIGRFIEWVQHRS